MCTQKCVVVAPGCSYLLDLTSCLLLPPLNGDTWLFLLSVVLKAPAEGARAACALPKAEGCHIEWNSWLERGVPVVWDREMSGVEKEEGGWHHVGR